MTWQHALALFIAAALAGAVNSVAGGGTLITFPALIYWANLADKIANATSTVALWPGQLSSLWGYRKEIGESRDAILRLAIPSLMGGGLGAYLLLHTPNATFAKLIPWLILLATGLFIAQEPLARAQRKRIEQARAETAQQGEALTEESQEPISSGEKTAEEWRELLKNKITEESQEHISSGAWAGIIFFQFLVAVYGGYFGAGIGILMLAALGFMGFTNIHRMNGLKNINGLCINAVAIGMFLFNRTLPGEGVGATHDRLVDWRFALLMAAGSIVGGYSGAGTAKRIGQKNVRRVVIVIGFALALSRFLR
jgi:uncharacterized membrane protein YfcA